MKLSLKTSFEDWKRNKKIQREAPEIWLLNDLKVGYIQIPKVATRSIQQCLANCYVEREGIEKPLSWNKEDIKKIEKKTAFHATHKTLKIIAENNFIFAFVRNPYERLYSAYKNKVLGPLDTGEKNIFKNHGIDLGISFKQFVDVVISIPDNEIDRHLRSQSWFLTFEGKVIPQYIGYLETFAKDWATLNKQFALGNILHRNSTNNLGEGDFRSQYDDELEEKVFNRYKADFELFGYKE